MFTGSHTLQIRDNVQQVTFPALVLYPTESASGPTQLGPYTFDISPDAPIAPGRFPLVVMSHGGGGSHLLYRSFCTHLARNGYVVAMPMHPGDNRDDKSLEGTHQNLVNRPRHISLTIDAVCHDPRFSAAVDADRVAMIGHSMGGYTALAVAGGTPWSQEAQRVDVTPDPRVRALVLLAPAAAFYMPEDSLRNVVIPILLLAGECDTVTPLWHAELVLDRVPDRAQVIYHVIPNAGHFSFISPFPAHMQNPNFPPSTDPEGFDRERFHGQLALDLLRFLDRTLPAA
jgi:predicted dienelactone hydrolase